MLWTDTTEVGCGVATAPCSPESNLTCEYVTCRYSPPGNINVNVPDEELANAEELAEHVKPFN